MGFKIQLSLNICQLQQKQLTRSGYSCDSVKIIVLMLSSSTIYLINIHHQKTHKICILQESK